MASHLRNTCGGENEQFDSILNFRDVGKTVNEFLGRRYLREGVLYRSARPDNASDRDIQRLTSEYGIKTVLDLRTRTEHQKQIEKHRAHGNEPKGSYGQVKPQEPTVPLKLPGTRYYQAILTGRSFEFALVRELGWWDLVVFFFLLLTFQKVAAIRVLTKQVLLPMGLTGSSNLSMRVSAPAYCSALAVVSKSMAHQPPAPTMIHCTAGKDRTANIVLLLLLVCEVPVNAIEYDYFITSRSGALKAEWDERLKELEEFGFTEDWLGTPEGHIKDTIAYMDQEWGGIEGYCDFLGLSKSDIMAIREGLWA